jgi:predicted kinase
MKLYIIRGLPASGKSTIANKLISESCENQVCKESFFEADMFFCINLVGEYRFDPSKLSDAHKWCQNKVRESLAEGRNTIVANTFTQKWEMEPYVVMARELNAEIEVIDVFDGGLSDAELAARNVHKVPEEVIGRMRERYQHDISTLV